MKDQRKTEIKVGITAILGTILFIWIIGWAKNFSFTSTQNKVVIEFSNVAGLEIGDNVTVNGVRKGNVEDISSKGDDVFVTALVSNDVSLKKDADFSIAMTDLMGGKRIEIRPGVSPEPLNLNKIQKGSFIADIPTVMSMVGSMQEDLVETLKQVRISVSSLNNYLTDDKFNKEIKSSVENISQLTLNVNRMIQENREGIKKLTDNSVELTSEAKNFITENKDEISGTIKNISSVLKNTDSLVARLNEFTIEVKEKKNNLGKLMYDEDLINKLNTSIKQINELTKEFLEQIKTKGLKVDAKVDFF